MFNKKLQIMKKLLCILWVAMLTMIATVFAQAVVMPVYSYFTITNKTTQENRSINLNDFKKLGKGYQGTISEPFGLGFYGGDQIEVKYEGAISSLKPQLTWSYFIGENLSEIDFATGVTATFSIPKVTSDNQTFMIEGDYTDAFSGSNVSPKPYYITLQDVRNDTRFYCSCAPSTAFRVTYNRYNEIRSYLTKAPYVTVTNAYSGVQLFSGYMNDNGEITFNTGGRTATVIVSVTVNGVTLPAERTYIY